MSTRRAVIDIIRGNLVRVCRRTVRWSWHIPRGRARGVREWVQRCICRRQSRALSRRGVRHTGQQGPGGACLLLLRWGGLDVTAGTRQGGSRRGSPRCRAHHGVLLRVPLDVVGEAPGRWEGGHKVRSLLAGLGGRGLQTAVGEACVAWGTQRELLPTEGALVAPGGDTDRVLGGAL